MVHCVVVGCSKTTGSGVSFFRFPDKVKNRELYSKWVIKVGRVLTAKSGAQLWEPGKYSHVCSDHFSPDSFTRDPRITGSIGYRQDKGLRLKKHSFPSIFPSTGHSVCGSAALESPLSPVRSGYMKREHQRVMQEIMHCAENLPPDDIEPNLICESSSLSDHQYDRCATNSGGYTVRVVDVEIQVDKPKTYVKNTQTVKCMTSQGTQTSCSLLQCVDEGTMTAVKELVDTGVQCDILPQNIEDDPMCDEMDIDKDDDNDIDGMLDDEWRPYDDDDDYDSDSSEIIDDNLDITYNLEDPVQDRKYIVFESSLKPLFKICRECGSTCRVILKRHIGSMVCFEAICVLHGHKFQWNSQPVLGKMPAGNILLAGSFLFSGASFTTVSNVLNCSRIATFSDRTFRHIQSCYLTPAINNVWDSWQLAAFRQCEGRDVKLGGDARCCSPGHTAKYGSYSLMDMETGLILDVQLVQVTEVKNSYAMEMEGLVRGLQTLKENNINVSDLTTDRHCQVKKYMATHQKGIRHWFDVWHVAKGVHKKLLALAKKKDCQKVGDWAKSVSNHLYWTAASSNGDGELVTQKWQSITNHMCNIHDGHGDKFPRCLHEHIKRDWIIEGSKAHVEMEALLMKTRFLNDVRHLSPAEQTSKLEAYHKVVCQFAPKFQHFFYDSMKARLILAAMHNNENCQRDQATKRDGVLKWKISYPRAKKGEHTLKKVMEECTYGYTEELLYETLDIREKFPSYKTAQALVNRNQPPVRACSANRVDLDTAITKYKSRFNCS